MTHIPERDPSRKHDDASPAFHFHGGGQYPARGATNPVVRMTVQLGERSVALTGRKAWALAELLNAGANGITTLSNPAPRLSHYIFCLRRDGFVIESRPENHGGPFAGHHSRYVLASPVVVLDIKRQAETRRAAA